MDEQIKFLADESDYISYRNIIQGRQRQKTKVKFICSVCNKEHVKCLFSLRFPFICSSCQMKISAKENNALEKRKNTNKKRFGVENAMQASNIKEKQEKTVFDKYGVKNVLQLAVINEKRKQTLIDNYGVTNPMQSKIIRDRVENTNLERYGVKNAMQSSEIKEKSKMTCLENYCAEYVTQVPDVKAKIHETRTKTYLKRFVEQDSNILDYNGNNLTIHCEECGNNYIITPSMYYLRKRNHTKLCTYCNPINSHYSNYEKDLYNFIKTLIDEPIEQNKFGIIDKYELDIYLPERKLAFEFDGLYWHSELYKDANYHLNKTMACESSGIQLIHIFEDEWVYKQDIVKSRISGLLGKNQRIYARKCKIMIISYKESEDFLNKNHIQGNCMSTYRYGLYYNDELVSLMTFGKSRFNNEYELLRFCNKKYVNVVGGASKLFTYFLKSHVEINEIISFADRRWSIGNLYEKLGFIKINVVKPSYYYIKDQLRFNRLNFQKHKLIKAGYNSNLTEHEIMLSRKIYRIYDCGNLKYKFTRNPGKLL